MKLLSYNCLQFNSYKSQYISQLLSMCDILYLKKVVNVGYDFLLLKL